MQEDQGRDLHDRFDRLVCDRRILSRFNRLSGLFSNCATPASVILVSQKFTSTSLGKATMLGIDASVTFAFSLSSKDSSEEKLGSNSCKPASVIALDRRLSFVIAFAFTIFFKPWLLIAVP